MTDELHVSLVAMTTNELAGWLPGALERFIAERIEAGESPERASSIATSQRDMSFPGGAPAPGHHVLHVVDGEELIGALWVCPGFAPESSERYVFLVELDEAHHGADALGATIQAAETWAAAEGATRLALNVFGPNARAQAAFEELGYVVAATSMFKPLE
ncbi:MAG TPA: GNAT family N-acetyltransferase [Acidimicrobiales bacterium]|jgi:GNAT superfamily N-acetyltransferase|nr:GNAT family N-acetyltransferase [Acidimicrobiales bacterium]